MFTFTPVALVKASISATKASSSDCTKYFQRSIESCAPCSGFHGAVCAHALAQSSSAGPVSAPAAAKAVPPCISVRRVNIGIGLPPCGLRGDPVAGCLVEQVHEVRNRLEPDLVARREAVALAKHRDDVLAAELRHDLDF